MAFGITRRAFAAVAAVSLVALSSAGFAAAADYGVDKLTIVVPFGTGGSADRLARSISRFLPEELGVPVVVVNKPGANCALGHTYFMQQPDDGSTALISAIHPYLVGNILRKEGKLNWDDFEFINAQWEDYYILLTPKPQPYQTAADLFNFIKANPGKVTSAIVGGDGGYLSSILILEKMGLTRDAVNFVVYNGGGAQRAAVAGNQVTFSTPAALGSIVIANDSRALAVFRDEPAKDEDWVGVPPINDALKPLGFDIPVIPADTRTFTVHKTFKQKHPERYKMLVDAYRRMLERDDFKAFIEKGAIGGQWIGPEKTAERLKRGYDIFAKYISYFN